MVFVPGHGDLETVKDVAIFRGYLADLASLTAAGRKRGLKGEALVADVAPKLQAAHPDYPTSPAGRRERGEIHGTGTGRDQARATARAVTGSPKRALAQDGLADNMPAEE